MSVQQQIPALSQGKHAFTGSLPGLPDSALVCAGHDDETVPLPDHFPEPYVDHCLEQTSTCSSVTLENGKTLLYCSKEHMMNKNSVDASDPAKQGVRRITDKYAAPVSLLRNGSISSSAAYTPSAIPKETLPSSPTPSITLTTSPLPSVSSNFFPVFNSEYSASLNNIALTVCPADTVNTTMRHSASDTLNHNTTMRHNGSDMNGSVRRSGSCVVNSKFAVRDSNSVQGLSPLSSPVSLDISMVKSSPALRESIRSSSGNGGGVAGASGGRYQSVGGISLSSLGDGVSEQDLQQVEMFYRSHKSEVIVCHSLANLYIGAAASTSISPASPRSTNKGRQSPASGCDSWEFVTTGIPLLLLDSGEHHRARQLSLVMAEKGTGFVLWKDVVSHLTRYTCPHANFHTARLSSDSSKLAGFSFDDSKAAADFSTAIQRLTSNPDDELLNLSKLGKKKRESKKNPKFKAPKKAEISQPCCFQHITKLERPQFIGLPLPPSSFPPAPGGSVSSLSDVIQDDPISLPHSGSSELSEATSATADQ